MGVQIKEYGDNLLIGEKSTDQIAFFGGTPTAQPAVTKTPMQALQAVGLMAAGGTELYLTVSADDALADGVDISVGTSNGTKIGTAAAQKLGFWNTTPVVQPSGAAQAAVSTAWVTVFKGTATAAGDIIATGVITGQTFERIVNITTPGDATSLFTLTVATENRIAQVSTADLSAGTYVAFGAVGGLANAIRTALVNSGLIKGSA